VVESRLLLLWLMRQKERRMDTVKKLPVVASRPTKCGDRILGGHVRADGGGDVTAPKCNFAPDLTGKQ
jgi:hypothetical protein